MGKKLAAVILAAVLLVACAAPVAMPKVVQENPTPTSAEPVFVIGMIYITPTGIPWSAAHNWGLGSVLAEIGRVEKEGDNFRVYNEKGQEVIRTISWMPTDDFSPAAAMRAAESMIQEGAKMVFITAEDWCVECYERTAPAHPEVKFACIRGPVSDNLISMYPKSWEGFCAACAAAATVVKKPMVGLLGAYEKNPQVASNHGACAACFTHAWASLHPGGPKPSFSTVYIDSWGDKPKENQAAVALQSTGAQVIATHEDSPECAQALASLVEKKDWKPENWTWAIGYDSDWSKFTTPNEHILTSVVIDWRDVYRRAIQMVLAGNFKGFQWNPGLAEGAISLAPFSSAASVEAKKMADKYQKMLTEGWRPCGSDEVMWSLDYWKKCLP